MKPIERTHCICGRKLIKKKTVDFKTKEVGKIRIKLQDNLHSLKCPKCGAETYSLDVARFVSAFVLKVTQRAVMTLPVGDFVDSGTAASILGTTPKKLAKSSMVRHGLIYVGRLSRRVIYNKKSVIRFKEKGDGRFPIFRS